MIEKDKGETALERAERYYGDYGTRMRELKKQGHRIMGYLCAFVPLEMIRAAGLVPFRIKGDVHEPITKADSHMETIVCPLVRSHFDVTLKERYSFLDGIVIPHACDSMCRTYDVWKYTLDLDYAHLVNLPHSANEASLEFFITVLHTFRKSLERYTGKQITDGDLLRAIHEYNHFRARVRQLYELRKSAPPLISGTEVTRILVAAMGLPVDEAADLLERAIEEVQQRKNPVSGGPVRIMIFGAEQDDVDFVQLVEELGAHVVTDFLCPGLREHGWDVEVGDDPIASLAERYLKKIDCGRTYRDPTGNYQDYLEMRFGHLARLLTDFKVGGVILYIYRYCDPFGFDVPALKSYLESKGVAVLYLEGDYSMSAVARLRTRVQAFLELIQPNIGRGGRE